MILRVFVVFFPDRLENVGCMAMQPRKHSPQVISSVIKNKINLAVKILEFSQRRTFINHCKVLQIHISTFSNPVK
jgi:hypothetical protein